MTTYGSLCTGYEGIGLGLALAGEDIDIRWQAENDPHAAKILTTRFPDVPNLGDIKTVDWNTVEPVEILSAGYPCQPFSHAGRRKGAADERHIWSHIAAAIRTLRPRVVFLENVAGHLTLGFDVVLADLATMGFDARWGIVRAADSGAPHGRARLFVAATDTRSERHGRGQDTRGVGRVADAGAARQRKRSRPEPRDRSATAVADPSSRPLSRTAAARDGLPVAAEHGDIATADTASDGRDERRPEPARVEWRPDAAQRGPVVTDTDQPGLQGREPASGRHLPARGVATDTDSLGLQGVGRIVNLRRDPDRRDRQDIAWGVYEPAIRRWEHVTGRPAPRPVEPGRTGHRLSPAFVEWMMGLPDGWVTDIDISRNEQLKALGNGVVPQQCALAWRTLTALDVAA